ncbi:methyl-accepting chemotaxis protein [Candidatus Viadribacter manganicus]|uniref:Chemotaxis protein n=1 Tax=Candidatus Viadribacter manganicus TaxID=1759059 RepID=A0A1B1AJM4_9PROT|nr:methyl-accepting chemotaxis protein [Candidatus Viadribacter manganicus]ANP46762.1 hypothetical protein ATE48_12990 [Candidatus Viadribacter manganicus]
MFKKFNSHLSIGTRLGIVSGLFVLSSAAGLYSTVTGDLEDLSIARHEQAGAGYMYRVWNAWQGANCCAVEDSDELNELFGTSEEFAAFANSAPGIARDEAAAQLFVAIADGSKLTLDPELSSFYLMDGLVNRIPNMVVAESTLDAVIETETGTNRSYVVAAKIDALEVATRMTREAFGRAIAAAPNLAAGLETQLLEASSIGDQMVEEERGALLGATTIASDTTEADFPRILTATWEVGATRLNQVLQERIDGLTRQLWLEAMACLALLAAAAGGSFLMARGLNQRFKALGDVMDGLRLGSTETAVPFMDDKFETGKIASTLEAMRSGLEGQQAVQLEASYKSAAFEGSSVATMMVDRDFKVIYANSATMALLRNNAETFRKVWPTFNPEQIVGSNIDMFHKNPSHQRQLLSDPSRLPYRTDISVGDFKFALNVSAVFDAKRNYVGNILQWDDVTASRMNAGVLAALTRSQAVVEFGLDGTILNANDTFCRAVGYGLDEIKGRRHSMFMSGNEAGSSEYAGFWDALRRGEFQSGKFHRVGKNGKDVWLEATYNPILDGNGKPFKIVKLANDATAVELERREAETERLRAGERQLEAENRQKQIVVELFGSAFASLAGGDLTARMSDMPDAYVKLGADFNIAMEKLEKAMGVIVSNAGGIRTGANEISQAADDLSRRTEQQAASLEETAAALDEITATVRKTADGANQANSVVVATRADAEASGRVVRETVAAMAEIEKSAKQISQIIGVIDEISFQTNLLALNAGVEAARAGEAGRGFAVVASEVRALAQRSSEAAKEIKGLISMSSQHVETGVDLVGEAGKALEVIVDKVSDISGLVAEIAASAQEQATALVEVNTAINQMDQVTQQNAAMVEESTAASHSLTQEADELMNLVARFRVGDSGGGAHAETRARKPAASQPVMQQRKRVAQFAAGNAAPKTDDWQDF